MFTLKNLWEVISIYLLLISHSADTSCELNIIVTCSTSKHTLCLFKVKEVPPTNLNFTRKCNNLLFKWHFSTITANFLSILMKKAWTLSHHGRQQDRKREWMNITLWWEQHLHYTLYIIKIPLFMQRTHRERLKDFNEFIHQLRKEENTWHKVSC